jgi:hypothetical protein
LGNGSKIYYLPSASYSSGGLTAGFLGSAVVSSSTELACSVNTQTGSGTVRVGTSNGLASGAIGNKLFATQVLNLSSYKSYVAVQNAGIAAADVTINYFDTNGVFVISDTVNVEANSSHVFYQDDGNLSSGFFGSATVESLEPLAGTVILYNTGLAANGSDAQVLAYNTFTSGARKVFGPRVVKNLSGVGFYSGVSCQNVGLAPTTMTANYTMLDQGTGTTKTGSVVKTGVQPGQTWAVYLGNALGNATLDGITKGYGGVEVTSNASDIACTFNESNATTFAGWGSTYSGFPDGSQTFIISFPQIVALGASSFNGGFQFQNTTATPATCDYTFSNGDVISSVALAGSESKSVYAPTTLLNNTTSFNGSAVVECNQPIVGIYNLAAGALQGDSFATNNGINK